MQADPQEKHNLVEDAEYSEVVAEMRQQITDYQQRPSR
jgi:hypothetical protein